MIAKVPVAGVSLRIPILKRWVNCILNHSFYWEYAPLWPLGAARLNFFWDWVLPIFS